MTGLHTSSDDVDVLATDGRVVHLRDITAADAEALTDLHDRASDRSIYLRFFSSNRDAARSYVAALARDNADDHHAIGAFAQDRLIGLAVFDRVPGDRAEFALLVADDWQHAGIGTVLLEHLVAEASGAGITRFVAEVLSTNNPMLKVMDDLGFPATTRLDHGETHVEFDIEVGSDLVEAIGVRERIANEASLRPLLAPRSVVVVGAGRRPGSVGHEVLRNLLDGGFTGTISVVNPRASEVLGQATYSSPLELPDAADLAVIALPADQVLEAVRACGRRGCRAAVLLGAGFGEAGAGGAALQAEVVTTAREHNMRLVGPNCIGLLNNDPAVRLDATFATLPREAGNLAVLAQSGAFGVAVVDALAAAGTGVAQFVSIGNKADVGGNDLLLAWNADPDIHAIAAYLESVGDPRRFARIAADVSRHKPIIAIKSGRTEVGQRAGRSHTAAAASSDVAIDALFRAAGVLRVRTMQEMVDAARLLVDQPLPRGPRVAVVGNSGGPEILAADALADAGLSVPEFDAATVARLSDLGAPTQNPLDLGAAVQPDQVAAVLAAVGASPLVDAVVSVFTEIAIVDAKALRDTVRTAAAASGKPFVAVEVGTAAATADEPGTAWKLPVYSFPESAAAALGVAYRYAQIKAAPATLPVRPRSVDYGVARSVVDGSRAADHEWMSLAAVYELLAAYGLPVCPQAVVAGADAAATAAAELGYPVVAKLAAPGLHKSDVGGVRLDLADEHALRAAVAELAEIDDGPLLLQKMVASGTELIVGSVHDAQCGALVMLGAGGVLTDVLGDRVFALAPLTDRGADELISGLRSARLLDGYRGSPVIARSSVRDVLLRVAAMVDELPDIAELDINPLVCRRDGLHIVDARIRLAEPPAHPDPLVRQLRAARP